MSCKLYKNNLMQILEWGGRTPPHQHLSPGKELEMLTTCHNTRLPVTPQTSHQLKTQVPTRGCVCDSFNCIVAQTSSVVAVVFIVGSVVCTHDSSSHIERQHLCSLWQLGIILFLYYSLPLLTWQHLSSAVKPKFAMVTQAKDCET